MYNGTTIEAIADNMNTDGQNRQSLQWNMKKRQQTTYVSHEEYIRTLHKHLMPGLLCGKDSERDICP